MNRIEQALQRQIVDYLWLCVQSPANGGPWWTAVNPVSFKSGAVAKLSKRLGMIPGTPDIVLCWRCKFIGIELKSPKGELSPDQDRCRLDIEANFGVYRVVRSLADFTEILRWLAIPTKESKAA